MNTLKFRAWDGKRITTSGIMFNNSTGCLELPQGARMELMQFTGFTDTNGKEIYEGDIVKVDTKHGFNSYLLDEFKEENNLPSINGIGLHFVGIVRIDLLRGLMFENMENSYQEPMFTRHRTIKKNHSGLEVIGNIHENPELLNQ